MRLAFNNSVLLVLVSALVSVSAPAFGQMELPGAVAPAPEGAGAAPSGAPARPKPRIRATGDAPPPVVAAKVPAATSLAGQTLFLNGRKSQIAFEAKDKGLSVGRLTLAGQKLSNPRQDCEVTPASGPIAISDLGRPNGLVRFRLELPACPITFDVLDGAVLGIGDPAACEFHEADCKAPADGLWGPQPGALGPSEVKTTERARAQAESGVRNDYKLLVSLTKDRPTIMGYARDQAGFTSAREEICRDYSGEGRHNFCAARLTEARVAALKAKIEVEAARRQLRKAAKGGKPRA